MATFAFIVVLAFCILINPITYLALNEHRDWGDRYLGECTCDCCTMEEIEMENIEQMERVDAEEIARRERKER